MKFRTFLITSSLLLSGLAWAGPNDADHKPMKAAKLRLCDTVVHVAICPHTAAPKAPPPISDI